MKEQLTISNVIIAPLNPGDIPALEPILRELVVDEETHQVVEADVQHIIGWMSGLPDTDNHRQRTYFVAHGMGGQILGCVAITEAADYHLNHHQTSADDTAELVNFFVASAAQGKGVGKKLFNTIRVEAVRRGKKYLVLDSGPRYQNAWPFYEKMFGYLGTDIVDLYGPGASAKTWKMTL